MSAPVAAGAPVPVPRTGGIGRETTAGQLAFEAVEIRSMPGFRRGGFALEGLSSGINVIHGPNGSGKTTTARAIEALLWPTEAASREASLYGRFRLGDALWTVDLNPARWTWQRNGLPAEAPAFPGETARYRYRLSLAELLQVDDRAFAAQIVRESAGGFDVPRAVERLGFGKHPTGYASAGKALQEARKRVAQATRAQEELRGQELQLEVLEEARRQAAAAAQQAEALDRQVELATARAEEEELRRQLAVFPEWMGRLTGEEVELLDRWRADQRRAGAERRAAEEAAALARRERAETRLPEEGLPGHRLQALREKLDSLRQREQEWREGRRREESFRAALADEERRLGGPVAPERLAALGAIDLSRLRQDAARVEELSQERRRVEAELRRLGEDQEPQDEHRLMRGVDLLARWLRAPDTTGSARSRRLALIAVLTAVMVALAGSLLAGLALVPALISAAAGGLAGWAVAGLSGRAPQDPREGHRQEYERLGLRPPEAWTVEAVERCLEELLREAALAREAGRRAELRQGLRRELDELEGQWREVVGRWAETAERLGLPVTTDLPGLLWLAERIGAWQTAHARLQEQQATLTVVEQERSGLLTELQAALEPFGYAGLEATEDLAGALGDLERRRERWEKAWQDERAALDRARRAEAEAVRVEGEVRRLFERLGLDPEDEASEARVRRAVAELERFRELDQRWREASWRVERARREVGSDPGDEARGLDGASLVELIQARERAREEAKGYEEYHDQITRTQERIRQAKQAHALEEALAEKDAAVDRLRQFFRQDAEAQLGALLAEWVQAESRDSERPQVFHRARELFRQITAGRYSLELEDETEPLFRALETETGEGRALEELSSGTRVQLLLAVRVAFVETQEQGARLPLVFDEVLANSDDDRAQAVIGAVMALARSGRQVFYFTAQWDEVARWRRALEGTGLAHRFIDLAEIRRLSEAGRRPLPATEPDRPAVPAPEGCTYQEYGLLLQVPGVDPWAEGVGGVHLWHLLDDPGELYRLLRLGVERWGPLEALGEEQVEALLSREGPGTGRRIYRKVSAAARVLETVLQAWRIGRGRPVDVRVLQASGAVSARFLARAADLAAKCSGDARRLLDALERGELPRFHRTRLEALREYLETEGYLDPSQPLTPDAIRARALAAAARDLGDGRITPEHLERLIHAVTG